MSYKFARTGGSAIAENLNVELSHKLGEREEESRRRERWETFAEIAEVLVLAVVAIATAWTGFQATKWDGRQSYLYGHASSLRFQADSASTYGGQELSADAGIFTAWLEAHAANNVSLEAQFARRFTPDFAVAFEAWLKTDPFTNPKAPAGPSQMPEYKNPYFDKAEALNNQASTEFGQGTAARDTGDKYVRDTVLFASVLFLVALAQRLKVREARIGLNVVAFGLLVFVLASVLTLPRI
jgi:hypothetical protein